MPYSDAQGKDVALAWYKQIQPSTVVDIGVGCGTYAKLMRDPWRRARGDHWLGIEAWQPYLTQFPLIDLYDEMLIADVRDQPAEQFAVDLVIAGDVLEHMTRAEAVEVMRHIRATAQNLIVSIPVLHLPQDAVGGNPYERHIDHWTYEDMHRELETGLVETWKGDVLACYWWSRSA